MGSTLGFSCPNLLVFLNLLFLGTCLLYHIFLASVGLFLGVFFIFYRYFSVPYVF